MANRPLVILHGWSDSGESFDALAAHLAEYLEGLHIELVSIGDYLSMSDEIRFDDLQAALDRAWSDHALPRTAHGVDAIVHSTGALVLRDWLNRHFPPTRAPIKHLVMLGPANFGSPLAHKGRSFIGRSVKGFFSRQPGQGLFNTGTHILKGLELASPYSWDLAMRDRFPTRGHGMFAPRRTLCTVLIGNTGYSGIRAIANEDGSDGTVRLSTANLNCEHLEIRFDDEPVPGTPGQRKSVPRIAAHTASGGRTAFRVVDQIDHTTITLNTLDRRGRRTAPTKAQRQVLKLIAEALTVEDEAFDRFCDRCNAETNALFRSASGAKPTGAFQNTIVRVRDQFDTAVTDYLLEFYDVASAHDGGGLARAIHEKAIRKVHVYSDDPSYRSLYVDTAAMLREAGKAAGRLGFSLTASPILSEKQVAGFELFSDDDVEDLSLSQEQVAELFQPHRSLLMDIVIPRRQRPEVFSFRKA